MPGSDRAAPRADRDPRVRCSRCCCSTSGASGATGSSSSGRSGCCSTASAPAAEALAAAGGWNEPLYRAWYLTGAVWTAGWLGLGTAFLLGRTRFGYTYAVLLLLSGLIALMIRNSPHYAGAGPLPLLYLIAAVILALAIGVETYFQNDALAAVRRRARSSASTILSVVLMVADAAAARAGYALDPTTGQPVGDAMPGYLRLLTPIMNITGRAVAGAGRRVLDLHVHAQEAGAAVLARSEPARRPVPVQPAASRRWRSS